MADKEGTGYTPRTPKSKVQPSPFFVPLNIILYLCLLSNGLAALYTPIQDCDEVFNFWEPAHYLQHGYGLQTWEYSPVYSIRSWLYVSLHAAVGKLASVFLASKTAQFYAIRLFLALFCSACQTRLYSVICRSLNPRIGVLFITVVLFSPGTFHAATAFLPSTFTMCTSMLGLAAFLNTKGGPKTAQGIMWFGLGSIVGWPFAGALIVPLLAEEFIIGCISRTLGTVLYAIFDGGMRCLYIMILEVAVDYAFFRKISLVPWNIVAYNIFGGEGKGPDIFGTEPWNFYIRNLLLNFNIWFILAILSVPLLLIQVLFNLKSTSIQRFGRSVALAAPFYMWLGIFTLQPHKEERFMYPAYPFLALNAALSCHLILTYVGSGNSNRAMSRIPVDIRLIAVVSVILLAVNAGMLRIFGTITAYNAPLNVLQPLEQVELSQTDTSVCIGKEWYRFPSSYFLPHNVHAKFIRSEFRGLLPGEFPDAPSYLGRLEGASQIPSGMNDLNIEDPTKYVDVAECNFLVDSHFPGREPTELEPDYILDDSQWETLKCSSFLDASKTGLLARLVWVPNLPFIPDHLQRKWGQYCLLKRRENVNAL